MRPITEKANKLETIRLKMLLQQRLQVLTQKFDEMATLEASLEHFANEYFNAVGEYADTLTHLSQNTSHTSSTAHTSSQQVEEWLQEKAPEKQKHNRTRLKESYHKLAKKFHPDHCPQTQDAPEMMQRINTAYHTGDTATLLRLEIEHLHENEHIMQDPLFQMAEKITRCEALINTCLTEYNALKNSPIFELHMRHTQARLEGEDFIEQVVDRLKDQIEHQLSLQYAIRTPTHAKAA